MSKETKEAKKAAKAEKKAAKGEKNPEIVKSVISAVTAVACVASIIVTSLSITDKVCKTNEEIAAKTGTAGGSSAVSTDTGAAADDTAAADDFAADDTTATDDFGTDDATAADDSSSDDTAATVDTGSTGSTGSSKTDAKTPAKADEVPVGTDVAKVVAYYNKVANATKAYKGKMVITGKQGANTKITETSFPGFIKAVANTLLPNDYSDAKKNGRNYTVTNGVATDGTPIAKILPIPDDAKMSKLPASGVQSASCTKSGNGYKIVIKLKPESTDSFEKQPPNHKACMDCLNMTQEDLGDFKCQNCNIGYPGGTITAVVNDKGLLTSFVVYNPYHITGTLAYSDTAIKGTAVIDASWRQELTIAY